MTPNRQGGLDFPERSPPRKPRKPAETKKTKEIYIKSKKTKEIHTKIKEKRERGGFAPTVIVCPNGNPPLSFLQLLYGFPSFLVDFVTFFAFLGFQKVFLRFKGGQRSKNLRGGSVPENPTGNRRCTSQFSGTQPPLNGASPVVGVRQLLGSEQF